MCSPAYAEIVEITEQYGCVVHPYSASCLLKNDISHQINQNSLFWFGVGLTGNIGHNLEGCKIWPTFLYRTKRDE